MTSQPQWKCIAQLGDADPVSYGGYFVYVDETGVYHGNIQASYINQGDTYAGTILYDHERQRYLLTSWGDWVERYGDRRQIA